MLQILFGGMIGCSLLYGLMTGSGDGVAAAMLEGAKEAVETGILLAGSFAFFCGMLSILRRAGAAGWIGERIKPLLVRLMGKDFPPSALEPAALNLTANLLGLGSAATPMGIEAARRMAAGAETAGNALCLFLVINSSSVQLLPTSVIALRAAAGSAQPGAVALPALAATFISTLVGVAACKILEKRG